MNEICVQLLLCVPFVFAGAVFRGRVLRKTRLGWALTLLSVLTAAGIWFLWKSDGSMGTGRLFCGFAFALGTMIGEVYVLGGGK